MPSWWWKSVAAAAVVAACLGLGGLGEAGAGPGPVRIAVLPCNDIENTFKKFYSLINYLKQETGKLDFKLVVPPNFEEFKNSVKTGDVDFALQDPHTYVALEALFDRGRLLRSLTMDGGTTQSGVVIVRQDSNIKQLSDLKGKTVMFGPQASSTKWLAATWLFQEAGINLEHDLKAYSHGGCCEDIAFRVYLKSVDAGVVCDHFLAEHEEKQKDLGLENVKIAVIARTPAVPARIFAARKGTDPDLVAKVEEALLKLDKKNPDHARIFLRGELGGFQKADDADYDPMRKLIGQGRAD
jgi:phosphonate transport system substrate-binding protein